MVPKKMPGGNRTPGGFSKSTPKVNTTQDDEDNLEFEEDSEFDDDEPFSVELDEESLDEEMDEEDLDEEDEDSAPSPTTKQGQPATKLKRSLPKTQTPAKAQTATKRKAEESSGSPTKRIRLQDYIPAAQVMKYGASDRRTVQLSNLDKSVGIKDVDKACTGAVSVWLRERGGSKFALARYTTEEAAQAALKKLQTMKLKGTAITVAISADSRPGIDNCALDVHGVPRGTTTKDLRDLFPHSRVLRLRSKFAKLRFRNQAELENAIKDPKCHAIGEVKLKFAFSTAKPECVNPEARRLKIKAKKAAKRAKKLAARAGEKGKKPSTPGGEKEAPTATAGKRKRKPRASKNQSTSPAAKGTPSTPGGKTEAPATTPGKRKRKSRARKSPSASPATKGTPSTPEGKKSKTPVKQALVVKTPFAKTPKSFKVVGAGKTPLPKQRGTPRGAINA